MVQISTAQYEMIILKLNHQQLYLLTTYNTHCNLYCFIMMLPTQLFSLCIKRLFGDVNDIYFGRK